MTSGRRVRLSRPATLKAGHDVAAFDCGRPELTNWLKEWGKRAASADTAITYVVCRGTKRVVGYVSISAGSVAHLDEETEEKAPRALRQNAPDPIPALILGRVGVDLSEQGRGLGSALIGEGLRRAAQASKLIGARALLVHALDDRLASYYESLGFIRFSAPSRTLYLFTKTIRDGL